MPSGLAWLAPRLAVAVLIGYVLVATVAVAIPEFVSTTERSALRISPDADGAAPAGSIAIIDRRRGSAIQPGSLIAVGDVADEAVRIERVVRVVGAGSSARYDVEPRGTGGLGRVVDAGLVLGPIVAIESTWAGDVAPPSPPLRVSLAVLGGLALLGVNLALRRVSRRRASGEGVLAAAQPPAAG